jgi:phosphohistidine phosphatase SixA
MRISLLLAALPTFAVILMADAQQTAVTRASLASGAHVIVLRHGATDDSRRDVYPFKFDDLSAQRLLSEKGRDTARQIGADFRTIGLPIGNVFTSRLNRAVETGSLISGADVVAEDALTDSGAGNPSSMANPSGKNVQAGRGIRQVVDRAPKSGTNTLIVTHKTNIADAFGKEFADIREGEAIVLKSSPDQPAKLLGRIQALEWSTLP